MAKSKTRPYVRKNTEYWKTKGYPMPKAGKTQVLPTEEAKLKIASTETHLDKMIDIMEKASGRTFTRGELLTLGAKMGPKITRNLKKSAAVFSTILKMTEKQKPLLIVT